MSGHIGFDDIPDLRRVAGQEEEQSVEVDSPQASGRQRLPGNDPRGRPRHRNQSSTQSNRVSSLDSSWMSEPFSLAGPSGTTSTQKRQRVCSQASASGCSQGRSESSRGRERHRNRSSTRSDSGSRHSSMSLPSPSRETTPDGERGEWRSETPGLSAPVHHLNVADDYNFEEDFDDAEDVGGTATMEELCDNEGNLNPSSQDNAIRGAGANLLGLENQGAVADDNDNIAEGDELQELFVGDDDVGVEYEEDDDLSEEAKARVLRKLQRLEVVPGFANNNSKPSW